MEAVLYQQLAAVEDQSWWHLGRQRLAADHIQRMNLGSSAKILDVGCGTGGTTRFLEQFGKVTAIDQSDNALPIARQKASQSRIIPGDANRLGEIFEPDSFDLITFFGVLYHRWIRDDFDLLTQVRRILKPGGYVLLAEPAFKILWRRHDELDLAKTRYRLNDFRKYFQACGFRYVSGQYFNALSFPICLLLAVKNKLMPSATSESLKEVDLPPFIINSLMQNYMSLERSLSRFIRLPVGVSLLVVGRKESRDEIA